MILELKKNWWWSW